MGISIDAAKQLCTKDGTVDWDCVKRTVCPDGNLLCILAVEVSHLFPPTPRILDPSPGSNHARTIAERVLLESQSGIPTIKTEEILQVAEALQQVGQDEQAVSLSQLAVNFAEAQPDLHLELVGQALAIRSTSLAALGRHADAAEAKALSRIIRRSGGISGHQP